MKVSPHDNYADCLQTVLAIRKKCELVTGEGSSSKLRRTQKSNALRNRITRHPPCISPLVERCDKHYRPNSFVSFSRSRFSSSVRTRSSSASFKTS
jgi:hypothetical protein